MKSLAFHITPFIVFLIVSTTVQSQDQLLNEIKLLKDQITLLSQDVKETKESIHRILGNITDINRNSISTSSEHKKAIEEVRKLFETKSASVATSNTEEVQRTKKDTKKEKIMTDAPELEIEDAVRLEGQVTATVELDNNRYAVGYSDGNIEIRSSDNHAVISSLQKGHQYGVFSIVYVKPNYLISAGQESEINVWDLNKNVIHKKLSGHTGAIISLCDIENNQIASGSGGRDNSIKIWDIQTGALISTLEGHTKGVYGIVKINPSTIVSISYDKTIRTWSTQTNTEIVAKRIKEDEFLSSINLILPNVIAVGTKGGNIILWNLQKLEKIGTLKGHEDSVLKIIKYEPGYILTSSADSSIKLWNYDKKVLVSTHLSHTKSVSCLMLLGDKRVFSGSDDGTVKIWNS